MICVIYPQSIIASANLTVHLQLSMDEWRSVTDRRNASVYGGVAAAMLHVWHGAVFYGRADAAKFSVPDGSMQRALQTTPGASLRRGDVRRGPSFLVCRACAPHGPIVRNSLSRHVPQTSLVQRTLPNMGGIVAGLDTHLGTVSGCWPSKGICP